MNDEVSGESRGEGDHMPPALPPMSNSYVVGIATALVLECHEIADVRTELVDFGSSDLLDARLLAAIDLVNSDYFRFELTTLHGDREPSLQTLSSEFPEWGLTKAASTRKLTIVVPLAVADQSGVGPTLVVPQFERSELLVPGTALIFPSYLVTGVLLDVGTIDCIVTHAYGPAFR